MEIIRLTTWIDAPEERCFRLATSAAFHSVMAGGEKKGEARPPLEVAFSPGDFLTWPGRCAGVQLRYTTRVDVLRPPCYFREVLDSGYFQHFEHDHHFTFLNEVTRMRDEVRFAVPSSQSVIMVPLVRRYLFSRIGLRDEILKAAAESEVWRKYLGPVAGSPGNVSRGPARPSDNRTPNVAAHRG